MVQCKFRPAWQDQCKNEAVEGEEYCAKHLGLECVSCGAQATHTCNATIYGLCCGAALCDECEHELDEDGSNGFHLRHCKKTEQKYEPWYVQLHNAEKLKEAEKR